MRVGEYELVNDEKLDRVINGTLYQGGELRGGIGTEATEEEVLVAYDRKGGLILKNGLKVKQGCFWDHVDKKAISDPEILFEMSIDKDLVDVNEEEANAIKSVSEKKENLKAKAKSKPRKKVLKLKKTATKKEEPKEKSE